MRGMSDDRVHYAVGAGAESPVCGTQDGEWMAINTWSAVTCQMCLMREPFQLVDPNDVEAVERFLADV